MLAGSDGQVRVRANVDGEVEIRSAVGDLVVSGNIIAVVEGDQEIESLSVRKTAEVVEILVADGTEVEAGTALMVVREISEEEGY
tara:strand:+ start:146 stop:400 length:255 start_codon:yes stop_codon:yes gene_type:complete